MYLYIFDVNGTFLFALLFNHRVENSQIELLYIYYIHIYYFVYQHER